MSNNDESRDRVGVERMCERWMRERERDYMWRECTCERAKMTSWKREIKWGEEGSQMENTLGKSKLKVIKDRELKYDEDESKDRWGRV